MNGMLVKVLKNATLKHAFLKTNVGLATSSRLAHDAAHEERRPLVTLDDLPVPCGSWQQNYNKNQAKFNVILGTGIVVFAFSVFMMLNFELINFNWAPPPPLPPRPELVKKK